MSRPSLRSAVLPALVAVVANGLLVSCASLPFSSSSDLDRESRARWACNHWQSVTPAAGYDEGVFDICFGASGSGPGTRPSWEQRRLVRELGGEILHSYHVPKMRARLPYLAIEAIDPEYAIEVEPREPYRVDVWIECLGPVEDELLDRIEAHGGIVSWVSPPGLYADLPDAAIPILRDQPAVVSVAPVARGCFPTNYARIP